MYFTKNELLIILAVALGYFVDLFDVLLFSSVRIVSLQSLGINDKDELTKIGLYLLNIQLIGMMVGGIFWGIVADKVGRIKVLFLSIITYSLANLLNAFVGSTEQYLFLRFLAGFGLAGELGAGITHIAETLPKFKRTYATNLIGFIGMLGAVTAGLMGTFDIHWRISYTIGGLLGFLILLFRIGVNNESKIFENILRNDAHVQRGNILLIFRKNNSLIKYVCSILVGIPVFYIVGILITLAPEFGTSFGMTELPKASTAIAVVYFLIAISDIASGLLSKRLRSRTKTMKIFIFIQIVSTVIYLYLPTPNLTIYYLKCVPLGIGIGYWAIMITNAAEIFGTNIRAVVTTTVPNFIRGLLTPITLVYLPLKDKFGVIDAAAIVGMFVFLVALLAVFVLPEKFEGDLNYTE